MKLPLALILGSLTVMLSTAQLLAQEAKKTATEPAATEEKPTAADSTALTVIDCTDHTAFAPQAGKTVVVKGKVLRTKSWDGGQQKKKKMNFIDFKGGHFGTVTFEDDFAAFGKVSPADAYKGKTLEVTGELSEHQGKWQIILKTPDQVKVIDDAPAEDGEEKGKDKDKSKSKSKDKDKDKKAKKDDAEEPEKPVEEAKDKESTEKKRVDPGKFFPK